jgi:hypothetical protein
MDLAEDAGQEFGIEVFKDVLRLKMTDRPIWEVHLAVAQVTEDVSSMTRKMREAIKTCPLLSAPLEDIAGVKSERSVPFRVAMSCQSELDGEFLKTCMDN